MWILFIITTGSNGLASQEVTSRPKKVSSSIPAQLMTKASACHRFIVY